MNILLFTSGTTSKSKAVMLSQKNICSNVMAMAQMSKMYPDDVLLSFLPLHHTFECTITFLYGFYSGVTVAFCDGLKYIAKNLEEYKVSVIVAVPLVLETINRRPRMAYYLFEPHPYQTNEKHKKFCEVMYDRCLNLIRYINKDTFDLSEYQDMFEKAKKCNYEDETIGII